MHVVTGFTADGEFVNDVLYHGGMIFYRELEALPPASRT
nr:Atu4866 domain-containing protein [Agrobacterium rubi]